MSTREDAGQREIGILVTLHPDLSGISIAKHRAQYLNNNVTQLARSAQQLSMSGFRANRLIVRGNIQKQMLESAAIRQQRALERYNIQVAKYGPMSAEVEEARKNWQVSINQKERTQIRVSMIQQRQLFVLLPLGIRLMQELQRTKYEWVKAKAAHAAAGYIAHTRNVRINQLLLVLRTVTLGIAIAQAVAINVLTLGIGAPGGEMFGEVQSEAEANMIGAAQEGELHAGGVTRDEGLYYLERGETIGAHAQFSKPVSITIRPTPGMSTSAIARDFWEKVSRVKGQ